MKTLANKIKNNLNKNILSPYIDYRIQLKNNVDKYYRISLISYSMIAFFFHRIEIFCFIIWMIQIFAIKRLKRSACKTVLLFNAGCGNNLKRIMM